MVNNRLYRRASLSGLLIVVAGTLAACASAPLPSDQIALSKSALNRAVSADATQYAPLEMKAAQDKMFLLERALGEKNYEQAIVIAEQIEVDANLAERKAHTAKSQDALKKAKDGIQVLKQEMLQAPDSGIAPSSTETAKDK